MKKKAFLSVILALTVAFGAMTFMGGCDLISPNPENPSGPSDVAVSSVSVTPSTKTITVNETLTLNASVLPANATNKTVTWTTSNASSVTVDQNGKIKGIAAGTATITATAGGKSGSCAVTVTSSSNPGPSDVAVSSVSVTPSTKSISVNETFTLSASVSPDNATNKTVTWSTSNASYVTVEQTTGKIKGIAAGTATITATAGGKSGSCAVTVTSSSTTNPPVENGEISYEYAGNETAAFEWGDSNPANATVQYKLSSANSYTNVDSQLIRAKSSTVARVDIVGLKGGETYDFKITTSTGKALTKTAVKIAAHDRSGYAFHTKSGGKEDVGAYKADGTLKDNAEVIYLTEANKNNVDGKGNSIAQYLGSFQSKKNTKPIVIRVIGTVGSATWNSKTYPGYSKTNPLSAENFAKNTPDKDGKITLKYTAEADYTQQQLIDGGYNTLNTNPSTAKDPDGSAYKGGTCLPIKGLNSKIMCRADKNLGYVYDSCWNDCTVYNVENVTIEGIGEDAVIFQWGFTFKTSSSVEVRNLAFDDYTEDACSFEGDSTSSKADDLSKFPYKNIWLHHNTFYEGKNYWDVCDEQDKGDGDGSTDFKGVKNITIAYNTYVKTHKTNLIGGGDSHATANVTFHHNYYNSCNQRMPLGRQANMHMYNNYYSGSTLYSISLRAGAYAFIENCVFTEDNKDHYPLELVKSSAGTPSAKILNCNISTSKIKNSSGTDYLYTGSDRSHKMNNASVSGETKQRIAPDFDTNANLFYYKDGTSDVMIMHKTADIQSVIPTVAGVQKHGGTVLDPDNFTSGGGTTNPDPTPSGNPIGTMTVSLSDLPKSFVDETKVQVNNKNTVVEVTSPLQYASSPVSIVVGSGKNGWTTYNDVYIQSSGDGTIEIDLTAYTGNAQITIVARTTGSSNTGRYYCISGNGVTLYSAGYNNGTGVSNSDQTDTFVLQCGYKYTLKCSNGLRFKTFAFSATNSSPTATMPAP